MSEEVAKDAPTAEVKDEKTKTPEPAKVEEKKPAEQKENEAPKETPAAKVNGEAPAAAAAAAPAEQPKLPTLRDQFKAFSKFGDTKSDGKHLTLSQSDKWMKQAKVIDKTITTTDTAIHFKKFKQMKIVFPDYDKYLQDLAKAKNIEVITIKTKLRSCGLPGTTGTTAVVKSGAVDRLTDTKKFTGSHKIRADPKGKASPSPKK